MHIISKLKIYMKNAVISLLIERVLTATEAKEHSPKCKFTSFINILVFENTENLAIHTS